MQRPLPSFIWNSKLVCVINFCDSYYHRRRCTVTAHIWYLTWFFHFFIIFSICVMATCAAHIQLQLPWYSISFRRSRRRAQNDKIRIFIEWNRMCTLYYYCALCYLFIASTSTDARMLFFFNANVARRQGDFVLICSFMVKATPSIVHTVICFAEFEYITSPMDSTAA